MIKLTKSAVKKVALFVVVAVVVATVGVAVANQWRSDKQKQAQAKQLQLDEKDKRIAALEAEKAENFQVYSAVRLECEKGMGAYAKLAAFQKQGLSAPTNCGPALLN